jgi:hypothetical protein
MHLTLGSSHPGVRWTETGTDGPGLSGVLFEGTITGRAEIFFGELLQVSKGNRNEIGLGLRVCMYRWEQRTAP